MQLELTGGEAQVLKAILEDAKAFFKEKAPGTFGADRLRLNAKAFTAGLLVRKIEEQEGA